MSINYEARPSVPSRRRILLSAFACSPKWGSEPGVGWQWLSRLARDYDVTLLTHACFRDHLEPVLVREAMSVKVHYVQAPAFGAHPHAQIGSRLYYVWWQIWVRGIARRLLREQQFDLIHHLTWGTLRFPCLLGGLGVPLVMGPLGGGESAPMRLFKGLPWRVQFFEGLRLATLKAAHLDPIAMWGPRRAAVILCKSAESLQALCSVARAKAVVAMEIGSPPVDLSCRTQAKPTQGRKVPSLLFAGRLVGVKGLSLALGAAEAMVSRGISFRFEIAGDGPLRPYLERQIAKRNLGAYVELLGMLPREDLMQRYGRADLFVFPSLHDSSGNVVLEALSRGLPVVCLDLGGPQLYVDESCGVVVRTTGLTRNGVERELANTISSLLAQPEKLAAMSRAASEHAARQSWDSVVSRAYGLIGSRIGWAT